MNGKLSTVGQMREAALRSASLSAQVALAAADAIEEVNLTKQDKLTSVPVTLSAAGRDAGTKTQIVTVPGVSADEAVQLIQPIPALASQSAYYKAGILCTGHAADSLTFTACTTPTEDLNVYIVIQEVEV